MNAGNEDEARRLALLRGGPDNALALATYAARLAVLAVAAAMGLSPAALHAALADERRAVWQQVDALARRDLAALRAQDAAAKDQGTGPLTEADKARAVAAVEELLRHLKEDRHGG